MLNFSYIGHRSCQGQVKCQNYMFHQFRLLKAEFSYKLCANRWERLYIMLVHNSVPELAYECQAKSGQVNNDRYTKNDEEEARDASCINHFRLILQQWTSCNPLTQLSSNFGSSSGHVRSSEVNLYVSFLELKKVSIRCSFSCWIEWWCFYVRK